MILIGLSSCKQEKSKIQNPLTNQNDSVTSNYILEKNKDTEFFNVATLEGKWELKKSLIVNSESSKINKFEILNSEFILGDEDCNAHFKIDSIHNLKYYIEGHFYGHSLKDEMKILNKKLYDSFKIDSNTFKGAITTTCDTPFHELYLFGDNLVVWYYGNYMQFVKKKEDNKVLLFKCKENDNGKSIYDDPLNKTCECSESTFKNAYKIFYDESPDYLKKNLLKKLPAKNFEWKSEDADVSYKWIANDTLKIDMNFQGGENHYVFYKNIKNKIEYKEYLFLP